jgi:hypothetical protein
MIEEAAGTRMYESKKQSAMRTIEKKDSKLQEIETVRHITIMYVYNECYLQYSLEVCQGVRARQLD